MSAPVRLGSPRAASGPERPSTTALCLGFGAPSPMDQIQTYLTGDQAHPVLPGQIRPGPLQEHCNAVAEADQSQQVHEKPRGPGSVAVELQSSARRDGGSAPQRTWGAGIRSSPTYSVRGSMAVTTLRVRTSTPRHRSSSSAAERAWVRISGRLAVPPRASGIRTQWLQALARQPRRVRSESESSAHARSVRG